MNSLYSSSPCLPFYRDFSLESQTSTQIFSQVSALDISKSRVPNELFYAPHKKIKLEGRYVTLPHPETTLCPHQRQIHMEQELNDQDPFELSVQTSNLPVSSVNQRSKEPLENQQTLNSHMNFLPTNSYNFENSQLIFNFNCPPVDLNGLNGLSNQADPTSNVLSIENSFVSNLSTNCFNPSSTVLKKPSLPGVSNDDPIWEYLTKEQEDFKQFVQKIKEIVAVCTNPTESLDEDESSQSESDLFEFSSDSDDEVFFPREVIRLKKTPGSKNSKKTVSDKKETKKNSKESANKDKKSKKAKRN